MDKRVEKIIALMKEDLRSDLCLHEMAKCLNLSSSHLRCLFKAETGTSVGQFHKSLRMEKAKELAQTTFLTAKEIISMLGINDQSHFARDFKKAYGMTFTEYRRRESAYSDNINFNHEQ